MPRLCDGKYLARGTFTTRSQKGNVAHAAQAVSNIKPSSDRGMDYMLYSYF